MEQYINKIAVLSEIENLLDKGRYLEVYDCAYRDGNNGALYALKGKLDTLEVKEVDLEKEISLQWSKFCLSDKDKDSFVKAARHFFELSTAVSNKAQKEG